MNTFHRLDWMFGIGHGITLLGFAVRKLAPDFFAGSLFQSFHILCGVSVFSVFFLWAVFRLARVEMETRPRLIWLATLILAAPVALPLIYIRFLRPTLVTAG